MIFENNVLSLHKKNNKTKNKIRMEKKEAQDLARAIGSLSNAIKEHSKIIDKQNQMIRENSEVLKELRTRLSSVANAISNGGTIVNG